MAERRIANSMTSCNKCGKKIFYLEVSKNGKKKMKPFNLGETPHKCVFKQKIYTKEEIEALNRERGL